MPREKGRAMVARNKKALHDFHIGDRVEAGIVLTGTEVKSLRAGRATLTDAFATIDNGEVWLRNANIPEYEFATASCCCIVSRFASWSASCRNPDARWCRWRSTSVMVSRRLRSRWRPVNANGTSARRSPPAICSAMSSVRWLRGVAGSDNETGCPEL